MTAPLTGLPYVLIMSLIGQELVKVKMDWFPWYPERYKNKTLHLTAEQDGIYRRLIDHYMETRLPLPDNDFALARIAGVDNACFKQASSILRAFFKQSETGILNHITCDELLDEQDQLAKFRTERARKGAEARHKKTNEINKNSASSKQEALLKPATITVNNNNNKISKDIDAPLGIAENVWQDFIIHRKAKKAPLTKTVVDILLREAAKASITPAEALEYTLMRGWQNFNATWFAEGKRNVNNNDQSKLTGHAALGEINRRALERVEQDRLSGKAARTALDDYDFGETVPQISGDDPFR
jgi:uncharacterized protein YdaU (DUF1376 family)